MSKPLIPPELEKRHRERYHKVLYREMSLTDALAENEADWARFREAARRRPMSEPPGHCRTCYEKLTPTEQPPHCASCVEYWKQIEDAIRHADIDRSVADRLRRIG